MTYTLKNRLSLLKKMQVRPRHMDAGCHFNIILSADIVSHVAHVPH